jgi:nitrogen fixation protein FixH
MTDLHRQVSEAPRHQAARWPWGIVAGLGAVVAANVVMISIALDHPSVPASADHFGDSLHWDERAAARSASEALGWRVQAGVDREAGLWVEVVDEAGHTVEGLEIVVDASRHDTTAFDRRHALALAGDGRYTGAWPPQARGLFSLDLELRGPLGRWVGERRIVAH